MAKHEVVPYRVSPQNPTFNALFFGDAGGGKTTLAASCQDHPAMADVLIANIEGGLISVAHRTDIHAVDIKRTSDLEHLYWAVKRGEFPTVKTIVIDSATELQTRNLEEIVLEAIKKGGTSRSGKTHSRDEIWQDDYGKSTTQLKRLFRWFKDLDINVIVTALAKYVYPKVPQGTDLTNVDPVAVLPSLTAKLGTSLMGYVDFVWYLRYDPEEEEYQALTKRDPIYYAKTRGLPFARALPPVLKLVTEPLEGEKRLMMPEIYDLFCKTLAGKHKKAKS